MTWNEFKNRVAEADVRDEDEIDYIDVSSLVEEITVRRNGQGQWEIY